MLYKNNRLLLSLIQLMFSFLVRPKVITLSGFCCTWSFFGAFWFSKKTNFKAFKLLNVKWALKKIAIWMTFEDIKFVLKDNHQYRKKMEWFLQICANHTERLGDRNNTNTVCLVMNMGWSWNIFTFEVNKRSKFW